jgi:hypothetical protein
MTIAACSTLPEYAAPKGMLVDPATADVSDVIPYQQLTRADFKGTHPPAAFAPHADTMFAATCAYLVTTPDTKVAIQPMQSPDGTIVYHATADHIRFQAQMDRNCSWWSPRDSGVPDAYILEHEQIHFALFELEVRRLNASIEEIKSRIDATAASPEEATQLAQQDLENEIQGRIEAILARSRKFDEETSFGYKPDRQKKWWRLVQSELSKGSN